MKTSAKQFGLAVGP